MKTKIIETEARVGALVCDIGEAILISGKSGTQ